MRIIIDHRTRYAFTQPQRRLVQALRMSPDDTDDQTVVAWRVDVDCDARLRESRDGWGNRLTMLYAEGPLDGIEITVRGEVLTTDTDGAVRGGEEPLPPIYYLRDTDRTHAGEALAAFFADATRGNAGAAAVDSANRALHDRVRLQERSDHEIHEAQSAFAADSANAREMAQMLIAGLRAAEIPARYVSGYRQAAEAGSAPHGWVEAHVADFGWLAVDPSVGRRIDARYVRVAIGLDAAGAVPVAGSRLGPGKEALDVDLKVVGAGEG